jgi:hypothetical protein
MAIKKSDRYSFVSLMPHTSIFWQPILDEPKKQLFVIMRLAYPALWIFSHRSGKKTNDGLD